MTKIKLALEQNRTRLPSLPVTDKKGQILHRKCIMKLKLESASDWEPTRHLMQAAEASQLTPWMDLRTIKLAQEKLASDPNYPACPSAFQYSQSALSSTTSNCWIKSAKAQDLPVFCGWK